MYGHKPLIDMRLDTKKPALVVVSLGRDEQAKRWHELEGVVPHVCIEDGDTLSLLDLRFLARLHVDVSGTDEARVREVFDACVRAKAERVIAAIERGKDVEYLDSAGVLSWVEA